MGQGIIAGAAIVSHHPGLMQTKDFRLTDGAGRDSDLIEGFDRLRARLDAARPDTIVIFDTHWFTTGYHLVDAGAHYEGSYVSDEMPWYLYGQNYSYDGDPQFARLCQVVGEERGVMAMAIDDPLLPRHYATINVVNRLELEVPVVTIGNCQNCQSHHFLEMGEVVGEAIARSGKRVVLLASGALSHKFNEIDWVRSSPRIFDAENVSSAENRASDLEAVRLFEEGRHDLIVDRFPTVYRKIPWEGLGGHYLQLVGAMGGRDCRAKGEVLSEYENARGTGNIHIWFEGASA
jgi:aromatic ring-opening dioxygenase catalytic subunit (LigB family)